MDIRILALDLDGTLLTDHNHVSDACREAVQAARAKGIAAVICTGRNAADSCLFGEQAGGMDWAVTGNGAEVRSLADGGVIFTDLLGEAPGLALVEGCERFGTDPCFYTPDAVYYGREFERFVEDCAAHGLSFNFIERKNYHRVPDGGWRAFVQSHHDEILKAILHAGSPALVDTMHQWLVQDGRFEAAPSEMFGGQLKNIEVNRKGVSKGRALAALAERLGCTMENVMAIGDSDNDLSMLRMAGLGVAMGNAPVHIQAAADAVTADNVRDGVARAIETYLL